MKPELEGHLVTELLASILKWGTTVKAALGWLPKITSALQSRITSRAPGTSLIISLLQKTRPICLRKTKIDSKRSRLKENYAAMSPQRANVLNQISLPDKLLLALSFERDKCVFTLQQTASQNDSHIACFNNIFKNGFPNHRCNFMNWPFTAHGQTGLQCSANYTELLLKLKPVNQWSFQ